MKIFYTETTLGDAKFFLAASEQGLIALQDGEKFTSFQQKYPQAVFIQADAKMQAYTGQLQEYFAKKRQDFTFPLDLTFDGTKFQQEVWQALLKIPYGKVATYSQIAASIKRQNAIRAVGTAVGKNPLMIIVPCHRVIRTDGTLGGYSGKGGITTKKRLLDLEGSDLQS